MPEYAYRLCGFASGVDGRPVNFKEPLPHARVCGLCGFVPMKLAVLPCLHVLCSSCLGGCAQGDGAACCPMDKTTFQVENEVQWVSPPRAYFEKQRVSCWNASNGCDFEGPVGELLDHFENHCSFHATTCPRCQENVTRGNLPSHYTAGCAAAAEPRIDGRGDAAVMMHTNELSSLNAALCSYHDLLTSIQSQMNELTELVTGISAAIAERELELRPDATTRRGAQAGADLDTILTPFAETSAAITERFDNMNRSLPLEDNFGVFSGETLGGGATRATEREIMRSAPNDKDWGWGRNDLDQGWWWNGNNAIIPERAGPRVGERPGQGVAHRDEAGVRGRGLREFRVTDQRLGWDHTSVRARSLGRGRTARGTE